jgi:hypothetical protein
MPAPFHDPAHIETRLLVVIEMLDAAVAEARREMAQIRSSTPPGGTRPPATQRRPEKPEEHR